MYEWAGGTPAFGRLTDVFYRRVLADPILADLFAHVGRDHARHVAMWLPRCTAARRGTPEDRGGYAGMLRHHIDRQITPEQRARWAQLIAAAADEAG